MKLYYSRGTCSLAVRITLYELGVACEYESVNLKTKKTETGQDFLSINLKGSVPTVVLDNQEVLTENAVIQQYLADQYQEPQLLPPLGEFKRYRVLEWLNFVSTELHKGCAPFFNPNFNDAIKNDIFVPNLKRKLDFVNTELASNKYIVRDMFSIADSYMFTVIRWIPSFHIDLSEWPNLVRYFKELATRKSIQQALADENLTPPK